MRPARIFIIFTFLAALALPVSAQAGTPQIFWENIEKNYKIFSEIKPILVNKSNKSIYLYKIYPLWSAHLQRFNEATKEWEAGGRGITCGVVEKPSEPIEIKPNSERNIRLAWEMSTDDFEKPNFFELQNRETLRPLVGKYKLYLLYAFEPWTMFHKPQQIHTVSAEFEIIKK